MLDIHELAERETLGFAPPPPQPGMSTPTLAVFSGRRQTMLAELSFQTSRYNPRALKVTWGSEHIVVTVTAKRTEQVIAYTSVRHADARLEVLGSECLTYHLWLGGTLFELRLPEFKVLRERLGPLGLRMRLGALA